MERIELINKLKALSEESNKDGDEEQIHIDADNLLLEYILDKDISDAFNSIHKWYS